MLLILLLLFEGEGQSGVDGGGLGAACKVLQQERSTRWEMELGAKRRQGDANVIGHGSRDGRSRGGIIEAVVSSSRLHAGRHKTRTGDTQPAVAFNPLSPITAAAW